MEHVLETSNQMERNYGGFLWDPNVQGQFSPRNQALMKKGY